MSGTSSKTLTEFYPASFGDTLKTSNRKNRSLETAKLVAFDPGKKGGIAKFVDGKVDVIPTPLAGKEIDFQLIARLLISVSPDKAVVEQQHARPGMGAASMFAMGHSYGLILGALATLEIPTEIVTPQAWKKEILAGTKKDKDAAIEYCRRAFPYISLLPTKRSQKPHDGMADAVCILEYGRRKFL